jgi:hypothetical protein
VPAERKPGPVPTAAELRENQPGITDDEIGVQILEAVPGRTEGALITLCSRPATSAGRAGSSAPPPR